MTHRKILHALDYWKWFSNGGKKVLISLYLYFQVSVVADSINISGQSNAVQFKVPECRLSDDFGSLFDNQKFSDVTLSVCGREFQVSRAYLSIRVYRSFFFLLEFLFTT